MAQRTWLITGVSSGFGRHLTEQLLKRGDRVIGTVRDMGKVADVHERYPETYHAELLDVTDTAAIHELVERSFAKVGRIDVVMSNAGYGLFGAAEELSDQQVEHIIATNLLGPIQLIRATLPHPRMGKDGLSPGLRKRCAGGQLTSTRRWREHHVYLVHRCSLPWSAWSTRGA